jgi:hypothetical protein
MNVFRRVLAALAFVVVVVAGLATVRASAFQSERPVTSLDEESGDDSFDIFIVDEAPDDDGDGEDEWKEEDEDEE